MLTATSMLTDPERCRMSVRDTVLPGETKNALGAFHVESLNANGCDGGRRS